jgi:hypothetical protein
MTVADSPTRPTDGGPRPILLTWWAIGSPNPVHFRRLLIVLVLVLVALLGGGIYLGSVYLGGHGPP